MASTVARESILGPPSSELDSEGSSGGEERDSRKRMCDDASNPKKRRKQTTPVRFPVSFTTSCERAESDEECDDDDDHDGDDDDDDDDDNEDMENADGIDDVNGEKSKTLHRAQSSKDENLNSEFRCQYCGHAFESNESLSHHIDAEHGMNNSTPIMPRLSPQNSLQGQIRIKLETQQNQQEEPESPVNLSGLSIKNFATSWLSGHTQLQEPDWSNQNPVTSVASHLPGLSFPGALAQYLPLPGFSMADAGQLPRVPVGPAPMRIFNPDAYCDLCNKEFCNKYFLKTHKANKHGIYTDPPPSNSSESSLSSQFPTIPFSVGSIKIEQPQQQSQPARLDVPSGSVSIPSTPTLPCEICQKRFKNEDSLRKHKQKIHLDAPHEQQSESQSMPTPSMSDEDRDMQRGSPSAMEALFKQEFGVEQEDTKFMPAPRHLSPQSIQQAKDSNFNADRLRRLGVLNPEAFCEICCKEYCNKYFLRTHKMKRHGIFIQDNEKSPSNPGAAATWHQIQTSPLNLIVADSNPGGSESNDKSEEYECKSCGIRFQTIGLFQTHTVKMHANSEEGKSPKQDLDEERTDSISEDLQKLQTMILQLNGIDSSKSSTCGICGRECENRLALKTHMSLEHGTTIPDEPASPIQVTETFNTATPTYCTLCEKDYQTHDALRQHIAEEHHQTSSNNHVSTNQSSVQPISAPAPPPGPPIPPPPDKKLSSMTPTSSYCEICNKELCNKYFMKTHMQRMHGIEIENGSQIGGVICNICNKELCSKYFLRVHKHNTHGIVDEGTATTNKQEIYEPPNSDESLKPDQLGDLSHRYFSHFTEVCPICNTRFRSIKWLKTHLLGEHGRAGIEKWREVESKYQNTPRSKFGSSTSRTNNQNLNLKIPNGMEVAQQLKTGDYAGLGNQVLSSLFGNTEEQQAKNYRCSYCTFTTPVLPFLFLHERSHTTNQENMSLENGLQCPICSQTFPQPELLHHHLLTRHQFTGLLSQFSGIQSPIINPASERGQERVEIFDQKETEVKEELHKAVVQSSVEPVKSQRDEPGAIEVTPQGAYKCAQCTFVTANLNRIKKHVRKDHRSLGDPTECVIAELSRTLRDVANKHKLPASYAMPQDMNSNPDSTVMQPFIIEEQDCGIDDSGSEKKFTPALVYLPVRTRVSSVLTASFTLSPA